MKKIFLIIISLFVVISCSKKEVPFEAFSAEAFAFDLGDGISEVNATVRVKGFTQLKDDENYSASVAYRVDLINPDSTIRKDVYKFVQEAKEKEPINDIPLDVQFSLDSTYMAGNYTLIYNIEDENSDNKLEVKVNFDLQWE